MGADAVFDALKTTLEAQVVAPNGILRGISDGEPSGTPESPYGILQGSDFNRPVVDGGDIRPTDWNFTLHLVHEWAPDNVNAERILRSLIDPIDLAIDAHIKLGLPSVARTRVGGGTWGYIEINGVWHRMLDITIMVREKEVRSYSA